MSRPFEIRAETVVTATPEQVWDAVNTPEGLASWLFPAPGEAGDEAWGGHEKVVWDHPRHSVLEMTGPDGVVVNRLENVIDDNGDGTLTIRYVHSGIFGDDWEAMYDGASRHTTFYQHTLAQYLHHFTGRHATYVTASGPDASREPGAFGRTLAAMGLDADAAQVGDPVRFEVPGCGLVEGEVDYLRENFLGIRSADALYRVFGREVYGGEPVSVSHHLFAEGVDADAAQAVWQAWIDGVFATSGVSS